MFINNILKYGQKILFLRKLTTNFLLFFSRRHFFKNKIENFMDSSDESHKEEEEEEEAMDQLFDQLENDEDKVLRCFTNGKNIPDPYVKENLEQSLDSQPADQGPAADLMHLFNLK